MNASPLRVVSARVRAALDGGRPVVALESTIIAHGMPYPQNLLTARRLESVILENGCVPATIAILNGSIVVGLDDVQLTHIAQHGRQLRKASRRDIGAICARGDSAATTVASTMVACELSGIRVFATGGIGGVHRGAADTFDESADLVEMMRTRVCVVCAGAKSVLDIPKTLERLETLGVPVITLGQDDFPAFYVARSGVRSPLRADSAAEVASIFTHQQALQLPAACVVAVPIPPEHAAEGDEIIRAIEAALSECEREQVKGNDVTPFLLKRIVELTEGRALIANQHLAENNARVAAQVAVALQTASKSLSKTRRQDGRGKAPEKLPSTDQPSVEGDALVIGATLEDVYCEPVDVASALLTNTSNIGLVRRTFGGVARNVAVALSQLGVGSRTRFVSAVGDDGSGKRAVQQLRGSGVRTDELVICTSQRTATYVAMHERNGHLLTAVADTALYDAKPLLQTLQNPELYDSVRYVLMDANLQVSEMKAIVRHCRQKGLQLLYEPTSVPKCTRLAEAESLNAISWMFPNEAEALELGSRASSCNVKTVPDAAEALLARGVQRVVVTLGAQGACLYRHGIAPLHVPAAKVDVVRSTSGAGDVFAAAIVCALLRSWRDEREILRLAVQSAAESLLSHSPVPSEIHARL